MKDKTDPREIIRSLRCTATPNGDCMGEGCPFYILEIVPEEMIEEVGRLELPGCDVDAIGMYAADLIEQMICGREESSKPIRFEHIFGEPVYIEFTNSETTQSVLFDPDDKTYAGMVMYRQFGTTSRTYVDCDRYGQYWRCWAKMPTMQEREAAAWEN